MGEIAETVCVARLLARAESATADTVHSVVAVESSESQVPIGTGGSGAGLDVFVEGGLQEAGDMVGAVGPGNFLVELGAPDIVVASTGAAGML